MLVASASWPPLDSQVVCKPGKPRSPTILPWPCKGVTLEGPENLPLVEMQTHTRAPLLQALGCPQSACQPSLQSAQGRGMESETRTNRCDTARGGSSTGSVDAYARVLG